MSPILSSLKSTTQLPDIQERFKGRFGSHYVPQTLMNPLAGL